jgi:putative membrane protein
MLVTLERQSLPRLSSSRRRSDGVSAAIGPDPAERDEPRVSSSPHVTADQRPDGDDEETEPDVRFTYANERTFLAWNRTSLALIATGVAVVQLVPRFDVEYGRRILGLPLIALGAYLSFASLRTWKANDEAMRHGRPLPRSHLPTLLAAGVAVVAVLAAVLAAFEQR